MKRVLTTLLQGVFAIAGWIGLVAARCPGKCPLCP
jgi:hypothetical protein